MIFYFGYGIACLVLLLTTVVIDHAISLFIVMIDAPREWRTANGLQPGKLNSDQPMADPVPSPTASASRKKQKTSQASLSQGAPTPAIPTTIPPSSSTLRRGPPPGARTTKTKSVSSFKL